MSGFLLKQLNYSCSHSQLGAMCLVVYVITQKTRARSLVVKQAGYRPNVDINGGH